MRGSAGPMNKHVEGLTVMALRTSIITACKANETCCYMGIDLSL